MISRKKKSDVVCELKEDAVLGPGTDFPVICMPVFQAKTGGWFSLAVYVFHEGVNGLKNLFLTGGGKFLEAAVKAGLKFVVHFISSTLSDAFGRMRNPYTVCPFPFSIDQA